MVQIQSKAMLIAYPDIEKNSVIRMYEELAKLLMAQKDEWIIGLGSDMWQAIKDREDNQVITDE